MTTDKHCYECKVRYRDPKPQDLVMYLHAWKYQVRKINGVAAAQNRARATHQIKVNVDVVCWPNGGGTRNKRKTQRWRKEAEKKDDANNEGRLDS